MFKLPRSSWGDYDTSLISAGGECIHAPPDRSRSRRRQKGAGDFRDALTPAELVNAILKAPVDLVYNGGIGTYVKASAETHAQVGDRANDAVRVIGELRCKVVGEGGNLDARSWAGSNMRWPAAGYSPTRSTIRRASIPRTTR
jgi:glutamate dehydrogenase